VCTKQVYAETSSIGSQHDATRFAAECLRPQLSINISCTQGGQQQTHWPPLQLLIDGTDIRTPGCYIDPAYYAGSVNI